MRAPSPGARSPASGCRWDPNTYPAVHGLPLVAGLRNPAWHAAGPGCGSGDEANGSGIEGLTAACRPGGLAQEPEPAAVARVAAGGGP